MNSSDEHRQLSFVLKSTKLGPINTLLLVVICSLGLVVVSCGDNSTGANGGGNGTGNGDGDTPTEPTFSNVLDIFNNNCGGSGCHIGETTSGVRLDSYDNVTNSEGVQYGELVVQAGNAAASPLVDKIESDNPQEGDRMPPNGSYLSNDQIDLIKQWIDDGAENDSGSGNGNGDGY